MRVDEFCSRLERVKRSGEHWMARCPAHQDKVASLSVSEGKDGRILVKCHAGCTIEQIVGAMGIEQADLFPERAAGSGAGSSSSFEQRIETSYDYLDEDGERLFQSVRLREPKDFRQRHWANGRWIWNLTGVKRVLYRLPELREAAAASRAAWVVEGEKDADALAELGLVATSNPMGAGAWKDEFTDSFSGCPWVLVVGDCDEPGRKHAHQVAASVSRRKIKVKVIDLAPERSDGYDLSDFIAEMGEQSEAALKDLAAAAPRWTPEVAELALSPPLPIVSGQHFLDSVPVYVEAHDYLGPFLHGGYRVHVAGPIGHGKTSFLMEALSAAVRGDEFLGWEGKGNLKALYIDLEMSAELLAQAIRDARLEGVKGFSVLHYPDGLEIDTNVQHRRILERACHGFQIVVIDPWYKLLGQELEYSSARAVVSLLDGIRLRNPELCMLVGFHAQEPPRPRAPLALGSISGFKIFQRPADVVLTFQRVQGDESRVTWVKNRSPKLDVKMMEKWTVVWERGQGFDLKAGALSATEHMFRLIQQEGPISTTDLAKKYGCARQFVQKIGGRLAEQGRVGYDGDDRGGRGNEKIWYALGQGGLV